MFERFTDSARRVIVLASEESKLLGHHFIGTEHLSLGVLHEGSIIEQLPSELTLEVFRQQVIEIEGEGAPAVPGGLVPFTPRGKQSLTIANRLATRLGEPHTLPLHIMLGVLVIAEDEDEAVAGRILKQLCISPSELRIRIAPAKPASAVPEEPAEIQPEPPTAQEILVKKFADWYTKSGSKRFGPDHPVSRLYDLLADQPDS